MTLRELIRMAEGAWDHTAHLLALIRNVNRGSQQAAIGPDEVNPYRHRQRPRRGDFSEVKAFFRRAAAG
ncbi:MAG TPA: hypothetical protein VFA26_05375 [Gemmataceae bacterium]|nr:hypothetical protein [Gemmataceae bacterium]